jgi:hypothetical protein
MPEAAARVDYYQYLCSREWAVRRRLVKERARGACERCYNAPLRDVHHLTYRNLGHEPLEELQGLCRPCHAYISAKSDYDPLQPRESSGVARVRGSFAESEGEAPPYVPDWWREAENA